MENIMLGIREKSSWLILIIICFLVYLFPIHAFSISFDDIFEKIKVIGLQQDLDIGHMTNFAVDSNGSLLLLDCGAHNVFIFNQNGGLVKKLGRQGKGPGEFDCPISASFDKNGNLYVCDNGWRKMLIFDKDFIYLKAFFITGLHFMPKEFRFIANEYIVMAGYKENFQKPMTGENLQLYNKNGKALKSFEILPKVAVGNTLAYDSQSHIDATTDNKIFSIQETDFHINEYDQNGKLLRKFGRKTKFYSPPKNYPSPKRYLKLKDKQKTKLYQSWTHYKKLIIHQDRMIILLLQIWNKENSDYVIDLYNINGKLSAEGIKADGKLLCKGQDGFIIF